MKPPFSSLKASLVIKHCLHSIYRLPSHWLLQSLDYLSPPSYHTPIHKLYPLQLQPFQTIAKHCHQHPTPVAYVSATSCYKNRCCNGFPSSHSLLSLHNKHKTGKQYHTRTYTIHTIINLILHSKDSRKWCLQSVLVLSTNCISEQWQGADHAFNSEK